MTRAERDRLIADQHLIIRLAEGVYDDAAEAAEQRYDSLVRRAEDDKYFEIDNASDEFEEIKDEAEAEIARLEGLEVEE